MASDLFVDPFLEEQLDGETGDPYAESSSDEYWAASLDTEKVLSFLDGRREETQRGFETSSLFQKIFRSLQYYYGYFDDYVDFGDTAITVSGEQGQILDFTINYYRYLIRQLLTLITSERPRYKATPANTDSRSRIQARLGKRILEFYLVKRQVEQRLRDCLEDALVYGTSFLKVTWNTQLGEVIDADEETGDLFYEGDVDIQLVDLLDVVWEWDGRQNWDRDVDWVWVRSLRNKWDLIAQFPEFRDEILAAPVRREDDAVEGELERPREDEDQVYVWEFFHKKTDALKQGRYVLSLADQKTVFLDMPNPYRRLPLYPLVVGKIRRSLMGWSPAFDIQKQQELLNEEFSKIATIHDNLGLPLLWAKPGTKQPDPSLWVGNIAYIEADEKPEIVNLGEIPDAVFRTIEVTLREMEKVLGLNAPMQGQAEGSIRANRMQLFAQEQTRRYNSPIQAAYYDLFERVGTAILELLQDFPTSRRTVSLVGKRNQASLMSFSPEDLYEVTGVSIEVGSSVTQTLEGKLEVINLLAQNRIALPKEEVVAILEGAPLSALTEGVEGELDRVNAENEVLMQGGPHRALATDNHLLDIKKHAALLSNPLVRENPEVSSHVLSAVKEHYDLWLNPNVNMLQMALGYAAPPPGEPPSDEEPSEPEDKEAA